MRKPQEGRRPQQDPKPGLSAPKPAAPDRGKAPLSDHELEWVSGGEPPDPCLR